MKRAAATVITVAAVAVPTPALAAPMLAAPLPATRSSHVGTTTGSTTTTTTTTTPVTTRPGRLTLNELSDHRALDAYAGYLTALINQEPVGLTNAGSYTTTISQPGTGGCKAALSKLTQPPYQVDSRAQHTLTVLGEEIGDDITIAYDQSAIEPLARFSDVLQTLRWSRFSGAEAVIRHYVNAQSGMLAVTASNLCLDAADAELHPDIVPDGTKAFLPTYTLASTRANAALASLLTLMQTYEIPSEKALVAHIATLADQLSAQTKSDLLQSGTALTAVLESN